MIVQRGVRKVKNANKIQEAGIKMFNVKHYTN